MQAFYAEHNADKLAHLDDMVEAWNEKEEQLNGMLIAKYGVGLMAEGAHVPDTWEVRALPFPAVSHSQARNGLLPAAGLSRRELGGALVLPAKDSDR